MLLQLTDFQGEYRLHNVNNPDPDLVAAIDQAQTVLSYALFAQGAPLVINNLPTVPPNAGLRQLNGFLDIYLAYVFSHVQLGVLGAGTRKNSEHPGQNAYATRNFFMIADYYRKCYTSFYPYARPATATATATDTLTLPNPDPILPLLLAPGMRIFVLQLNTTLTLASITATTLQVTTTPFTVGNNYDWVQDELELVSKFSYI